MESTNLYARFAQTARTQPARPAVLGPDPRDCVSYASLDGLIRSTAECLRAAGVRPGHCVGLHCRSGAPYIALTYAAWRCDACVVPIPVEFATPEKEQVLRTVAVDFVIADERRVSFLAPFQHAPSVPVSPELVVVPVRPQREPPPDFKTIHSAFIRFSSGTTGAAKGVVLSHETVYERITAANEALQIGPDDRVVWLLSMAYHFTVSIVGYLTFGAGVILTKNHFAQAVRSAAQEHRATIIYGSPTHYTWLARDPAATRLPELRLAISTAAPLDRDTASSFAARFGVPVTQALGIIEVGLPFINLRFAADKCDAVGQVLPAYQLRLEDVGLGPYLKEIWLRGKGFLDAYYDPWRARTSVMPDGWFHTGDVGEVDADGDLFLRGRIKDVISVLGMKFFPLEVENVLASHPAIASACVLARPDARLGEVPEASVVLRVGAGPVPSSDELTDYCCRRLAAFKVPQRIDFVDSLPRTASGKILRRNFEHDAEIGRGER